MIRLPLSKLLDSDARFRQAVQADANLFRDAAHLFVHCSPRQTTAMISILPQVRTNAGLGEPICQSEKLLLSLRKTER